MAEQIRRIVGGELAVAPSSLEGVARALERLEARLADCGDRAATLMRRGISAGREGEWIGEVNYARHELEQAARAARTVARQLERASDNYLSNETRLAAGIARLAAPSAYVLGSAARIVALLAMLNPLGALVGAAGVAVTVNALTGSDPAGWLEKHKALLSDPRFVALLRQAVSATDNALAGLLGVNPLVTAVGDDDALGFLGYEAVTKLLIGAGVSLDAGLKETGVRVRQTQRFDAPAPTSLAELAARIPDSQAGGPQVRVDVLSDGAGNKTFFVYITGTIDPTVASTSEPFDNTSNLYAVTHLNSGSLRVVAEALEAAGVQPGDTVVPVGYSQGGILAMTLAANDSLNIPLVMTLGSPVNRFEVADGTIALRLEHAEDLIPALSGVDRALPGPAPIVARRSVLDALPPLPGEWLPAHRQDRYVDSAKELSQLEDARITDINALIARLGAGTTTTTLLFRGERTSAGLGKLPARERAQHEADKPGGERQNEGTEDARPEEAVDRKAKAHGTANE